MNRLEIHNLTKRYGSHIAVNELSLDIPEGCIFGLLGRNGAGKTTTINCILGLARPSSGHIRLFGNPLQPQFFHRVAYVGEGGSLEGFMTGREHATLRAREYPRFDRSVLIKMAERFRLNLDTRVRALSKGQRQALAIALSFAQRPELVLLDEPSSGLDPVMQRCLLETIVEAGADGMTVLFSSHQIGDVERTAERIAILDEGRLALVSDLEELRRRRSIVEGVFSSIPDRRDLERIPARYRLEGTTIRIYANGNADLIRSSLSSFPMNDVRTREMTLEDIFFDSILNQEPVAR